MEVVHSTGTLQSPSIYSDSASKTGSSKSAHSTERTIEIDLTKDNAASPIDLECTIQAERITKILNETIYKIKTAVALPELMQEYNTLNSILSSTHMDDLIFIFEQYDNPLFSASLMNMEALEDLKGGDLTLKNRLNPELGHLIYILSYYDDLRPKVEEIIQQMRSQYLSIPVQERVVKPTLEYLLAFEKFRDQMIHLMTMTAAEQLSMKILTRKLENANQALISKIVEYAKTIKEESENFQKTMAHKADMIAKLEQELLFLDHAVGVRLKKQILDSDRQMVLMSRSHAVKFEMLKEEEVETREGYENLLNSHLIDEKNQRARRFKVETQLLSWLQKYDTEMTDKQTELDDYTEKYEAEVKKIEELEEKLVEQDKEYIPLMDERDKEYHEEMTAKMNAFLIEHSARVLQKAWKDVLANRSEKKKLKKLVQKKKEAEEKAEKRAEAERKAAERAEKAAKKKEKKNK